MPVPNPHLIKNMLELKYAYVEFQNNKSTVSQFTSIASTFFNNAVSIARQTQSVNEKLTGIFLQVQEAVEAAHIQIMNEDEQNRPAKTVELWFKLITKDLIKFAEDAQNEKTLSGISLSSDIIHVVRSYAIWELTRSDDAYKKIFMEQVANLRNEIAEYHKKRKEDLNQKNGKAGTVTTNLRAEYHKTLVTLAFLNLPDEADEAWNYNLLTQFKSLTTIPDTKIIISPWYKSSPDGFGYVFTVPYQLQPNLCLINYAEKYQQIENTSWKEYLEKHEKIQQNDRQYIRKAANN